MCGSTDAINLFDHSSQVKKMPAVVISMYKPENVFKKNALLFLKRNTPARAKGYNKIPVIIKTIF